MLCGVRYVWPSLITLLYEQIDNYCIAKSLRNLNPYLKKARTEKESISTKPSNIFGFNSYALLPVGKFSTRT